MSSWSKGRCSPRTSRRHCPREGEIPWARAAISAHGASYLSSLDSVITVMKDAESSMASKYSVSSSSSLFSPLEVRKLPRHAETLRLQPHPDAVPSTPLALSARLQTPPTPITLHCVHPTCFAGIGHFPPNSPLLRHCLPEASWFVRACLACLQPSFPAQGSCDAP